MTHPPGAPQPDAVCPRCGLFAAFRAGAGVVHVGCPGPPQPAPTTSTRVHVEAPPTVEAPPVEALAFEVHPSPLSGEVLTDGARQYLRHLVAKAKRAAR